MPSLPLSTTRPTAEKDSLPLLSEKLSFPTPPPIESTKPHTIRSLILQFLQAALCLILLATLTLMLLSPTAFPRYTLSPSPSSPKSFHTPCPSSSFSPPATRCHDLRLEAEPCIDACRREWMDRVTYVENRAFRTCAVECLGVFEEVCGGARKETQEVEGEEATEEDAGLELKKKEKRRMTARETGLE